MPDIDAFQLNISAVDNLVSSGMNKTNVDGGSDEGVAGDFVDDLELNMTDEELVQLATEWESEDAAYSPKVKPRQDKNKLYYTGRQESKQGYSDQVIPSNLIFEAEETFIPQALSKNPEPVVWSDNTDEGKTASNDLKTMLQYHADVLCLRRNLGVMVRHWSIYFVGVIKHGWDKKSSDITLDIRKPQNFILAKDGYVDVYGNFIGTHLGEKIESTAKELIDLFPAHKDYITLKVNVKLGTKVIRTEWWTDEYCFTKFEEIILDKHKNEFFAYPETTIYSEQEQLAHGLPPEVVTQPMNHFARPRMPYTFLSVFSLQEHPHDITNLIEQNIPNQDRILERDKQITRNLKTGNNSIALSGLSFNSETARQAAQALEDGDPVLVPDGQVENAIKRIPANNLPSAIFTAQDNDKNTLRSVFGTQGLTAQPQNEDTTARGMILNQSHDSSRIGGGIGDALEQVADNIFNWWVQMYCVFYDEPHYGAIMGAGRAVEYTNLVKSEMGNRKFVVSVAPNSMRPKDEVSEQNLATELADKGWLDPINLFKKLDYPDPMETAKMVTMWKLSPQLYLQTYFPEAQPQQPQLPGAAPNPPNVAPEGWTPPPTLGAPPANASLSQVPLNK